MRKKIMVATGTVCLLAFCGSTVSAAPARIHYSTFLHSGPGAAYPVLDEVEHDTAVDAGPCQAGWCRISVGRVAGWVDRGSLVLAQPAAGVAPQAQASCFTTGPSNDAGPEPRRFCEDARPAGPTSR